MESWGSVVYLCRSISLHDCLMVNGTSKSMINIPSHGTAARVLTSGHPPETKLRVLTYGHSPGPLKHDIVFGLKVCKPLPVHQNKMEPVEELRRALEAAQAETAALRAAAEGADRAPRVNGTGNADEADSAYRASYDDGHAGTGADDPAGPNARQGANTAIFFWGSRNRQVPKLPKNEDEAATWRLHFRAHLDGMGLGYTLDHAVTPVPVKGDQRHLISRYGEQPVQQAQAAWACLLNATVGAVFEERVLSAVTVRYAWCQILSWTGPSSEAETLLLERQLETVRNYGEEDPKLFFPGWTSCLPACDRSMSTKPRSRSLTSSSAIFPITTRSRSAPGSTLVFFGAETWSILSAPPEPPAKCVSSNSGRYRG